MEKKRCFQPYEFPSGQPWFNTLIYGYLGSILRNGTPLRFFKLVYWLFNKAKTLKVGKDLRCLVQIKSLLIAFFKKQKKCFDFLKGNNILPS